jgi:4'-phosphopantetheinyl transferase
VHVWWATLDGAPAAADHALAAGERARAARLLSPAARRHWIAARAGLRRLLGAYLRCEPADIELALAPGGKPRLADGAAALRFNVSHSGAHALYAVGLQELGVDIELARTRPRMRAVAPRLLDPQELARVQRLAPWQGEAELLAAWVRREAAVKCLGTGLAGAADTSGLAADADDPDSLWLASLPPIPIKRGAQAALAAEERPRAVRCLRLAGEAAGG